MDKKTTISIDQFLVPGFPDEFETKLLLSECGIPVPRGMRFLPGEKFDKEKFIYPVVVKVCSAHILHKTDRDGVVMGVESSRIEEVLQELEKKFPGTPILRGRTNSFPRARVDRRCFGGSCFRTGGHGRAPEESLPSFTRM
jgi:hypothetical protein